MDGDWEEVGRVPLPPPAPNLLSTPITTLAFDTSHELLWAGNEYGRVSSFYGVELQRYTSFKCGDDPVRQILFHDKGVIALGPRSVHMAMRRGPPIWHISHEEIKDLRCMSYTSRGTAEILVAGLQHTMFIIDVDKGVIIKQIPTNNQYTIMKRSRYICAATTTGAVDILDSVNLSIVKTWQAHHSAINDMDAQHDFIVTCGYSPRQVHQQQGNILDGHVSVFDLKNLVSLSPIAFPARAAYVRMHPRMSTTSIIISLIGQMHVVDLMNVNTTSSVRQAQVFHNNLLTMAEISPSGEAIALADSECSIHLWGSPPRIRFAEISNPVEFADQVESTQHLGWSHDTPLSSIGMPYYRDTLLSAWPSHLISEVGAPPPKIDPKVIASLTTKEWGSYGRNTRTLKRNQVENTRSVQKVSASLQAPKFLSEKARESAIDPSQERRISDVADAIGATELSSLKAEVPVMYRNVEIKYSKFGVDDFDFGFYNKTEYSGLETNITNSYANSLLQVLRFTPTIRNVALQHTASACMNNSCLLCELGFLIDMLEKAMGSACQANNLLKTLSGHPQVGQLGLSEEDSPQTSLATLIQNFTRFFMGQIAQDSKTVLHHNAALDEVLATQAITAIRCLTCRSEQVKPGNTYVHELIYPMKTMNRHPRAPRQLLTFSQVLKLSLEREITSRAWCNRCNRYQSLQTRKTIHSLPAVIMLNAAANTPDAKQFWDTPGCLPTEIGLISDQNQVYCFQGDELKHHLQRGMRNIAVYSLIGFVADIDSGQHQKPHLVSMIDVAHSLPVASKSSMWHLFNDFLIRPSPVDDSLAFDTSWKVPAVITYQLKTANNRLDDSWKQNLDTSLLYMDHNTHMGEKRYKILTPNEAPTEGTIIALDAEFVSIRQPEIEMNSDGERETIRPIAHALARVSVLRGSGENEGLPFIDDYVMSREPIVDYLTSYSGIKPDDLNPQLTKHNLVPLKVAYKKLWILLNLGCKFLGHGLKQDFRVTNIHIPKSHVIDTAEFFKPGLRILSLAFLAWFILKEDIQVGTHDSIEDARTALKLYRKYLEYKDAGIMDVILSDINKRGRETNFRAPAAKMDGQLIERTETPNIAADGQIAPPRSGALATGTASRPTTPARKHMGLAPGSGGGST